MFRKSWTASGELTHASSCCAYSRLQAQAFPRLPRCHLLRETARQHPLTTAQVQSGQRHAVVGIDLGTTNSAVAVVTDEEPRIIECAGNRTTPSIVSFQADGSVLVGHDAQRRWAHDPDNTFYSVKRLIGRDFDDVREDAEQLAYDVMMDEDEAVVLPCRHTEEGQLYPEEVSAYVVAQLLAAAELQLSADVRKAVISVPAYFSEAQRDATVTAGRIAGLDTVKLIREPVAAALAYGLGVAEDETVLVLDLGGGTFDVSILELGGGTVEVLATGGDPRLGGDDWDAAIVAWLIEEHLQPAGVDCDSPSLKMQLKSVAESAKVALSTAPKVRLRMPIGGAGGGPLQVVITQQDLARLSSALFRRARLPIDQACWQTASQWEPDDKYLQAGVDLGTALADHELRRRKKRPGKGGTPVGSAPQLRPKRRQPISQVLLVGGATRMPAFRRFVENMTGLRPLETLVDPDEAVALGAAVHAGILEGSVADIMVMDIWQASLLRALAKQQLRDAATSLDEAVDTMSEDHPAEVQDEGADSGDTAIRSAAQADAAPADGGIDEWGPADLDSVSEVGTELQQRTRV